MADEKPKDEIPVAIPLGIGIAGVVFGAALVHHQEKRLKQAKARNRKILDVLTKRAARRR